MTERKRRKKLLSNIPSNLYFWRSVFKDKKQTQQFIERGNEKQHAQIIKILNYLRKFEKEYYEKINGKIIFRKLKGENNA